MHRTLLIFETHPVQYRAPVFQELERLVPGSFEVIYASDCSVRGFHDAGFGDKLAWDIPLLDGYPFRILGTERGKPLSSWGSLTGRGIFRMLREIRPKAILMHTFNYRYDLAVYLSAYTLRIPIWIRVETQDEAFERGLLKTTVRSVVYRTLYSGVDKAFYIGSLNRKHYLRHGMHAGQLIPAYYCTPNVAARLSLNDKLVCRQSLREQYGIPKDALVIAFVGKLIQKKDPGLLITAAELLPKELCNSITLMFVGSGELKEKLLCMSEELRRTKNIKSIFAGFVNQSELVKYYLCSDIVVLPSRRMGETWGLVINEALQAGCGAIVTEAVGCSREFGSWERVRVIPIGDVSAMARAISDLSKYRRSFDWATESIQRYSIEAAATAIADEIRRLQVNPEIRQLDTKNA